MTELLFVRGDYRVGCILSVPVRTKVGIVDHKGVLTSRLGPDGLPTVVHNAKIFDNQVIETTMSDYGLMREGPVSSDGYPGTFPPEAVVIRARSQIMRAWRPWYNCEHFALWAHGLEPKSPQMRSAGAKTAGIVAGAVALLLARK